ncbi:amyloid-beta A4 precursor protein-binding family A member 1-like [Vanacampus margaritifer]
MAAEAWCRCGHCIKQKTYIECFCCHEHELAVDKMEENKLKCLTLKVDLPDYVFHVPSLELMYVSGMIRKYLRDPAPDQLSNQQCRLMAYRTYTLYLHQGQTLRRHKNLVLNLTPYQGYQSLGFQVQMVPKKILGPCPDSGSSSLTGAESESRLLPQDGSFESSPSSKESRRSLASFPTYVDVPGPCDPDNLIDGIILVATYLGSTQLLSFKTPTKNIRMMQAQEAVTRIKALEDNAQPMTQVDLFISTQRIKVLNADSQETILNHPLRTISYIADIGNIVVLMARRRMSQLDSQETVDTSDLEADSKCQYKIMCHVFESEDAQLIAQSIGQAFSVSYQEFLRATGINSDDLSQKEYSDLANTRDMYNDDLIYFSKSENCKEVLLEKAKGEILGVVIVESGWGSILPTFIIANMMHAGPAERSGRLNIGDQIMSISGTSLVGLPLSTCQSLIKGLKNQSSIKMTIVRCPPVTTVLIRRPDSHYQLGFSVQNGIICSLMRGGIAERGGVRVGHCIIEINSQSVVATPHEKIVHLLTTAVGKIHMKTMPAAMYRLLTAQEQPIYI